MFGILTSDMIKFYVLVFFLFMFLRFVHLMIKTQAFDKERHNIRKLFILTEIFIWSAFAIWISYMLPQNKFLFALFLLFFIGFNIVFWVLIKNKIAKLVFISAFKLKKNDNFKINDKFAQLIDYQSNNLLLIIDENKEKIKYDKILSYKILKPFKQKIEISLDKERLMTNPDEIYATLKENNFINANTKVKIQKETDLLIIEIETYSKKEMDKIIGFLKTIL